MPAETVYYSDGIIWITNQRVAFVGKTYWLADIQAVDCWAILSNRALLPFTLCTVMFVLVAAAQLLISPRDDYPEILAILDPLVIGFWVLLLVAIGAVNLYLPFFLKKDPMYILRLGGKFGEAQAYSSLDESYIQMLIYQINRAITLSKQEAS